MEYLVGMIAAGLIWAACFFWREDLQRRMLWSGIVYVLVMTAGFFAVTFLTHIPEYQTINPGYWSPDTLFDLNNRTGGFSIEDILFMFFFGGIAAGIYELVTRTPPGAGPVRSGIKLSIPLGICAAALVAYAGFNLMYSIIAFGCVGALVIWMQRPDLVRRSLMGGSFFLALYIACYKLFLVFFPSFVTLQYHFDHVSGLLPFGVPLEEYLFAFGFGCMWSVLYSYTYDVA